MYEFKLPDVGEGIHEAEIAEWLVNVGQTVALDQPMLEIQTDKALVEIPCPVAGTIVNINYQPGQIAAVGDVLVVIEAASNVRRDAPHDQTQEAKGRNVSNPQPAIATPSVGIAGPGQRVLAAPAVRQLARTHGIDLQTLQGSGQAGRILLSDLKRAIEQPDEQSNHETRLLAPPLPSESSASHEQPSLQETPASPPALKKEEEETPPSPTRPPQAMAEATECIPLVGLRRRIAERMAEAWQIPHVTSFEEVEVSKLVALRRELKPLAADQEISLTYLPFIIKATVQALKRFPDFNATLDLPQQQIVRHRHYHIGLATAIPDGLLVPVIQHADQRSLLELAHEINRLAELARSRRLPAELLSGSTFTISNFGSMGGQQGTPIINPPEAAILGCGRIEDKVIPVNGEPAIRPVLHLALSFDHRLIDGAAAAQFLGYLKQQLTDPNRLILEM